MKQDPVLKKIRKEKKKKRKGGREEEKNEERMDNITGNYIFPV